MATIVNDTIIIDKIKKKIELLEKKMVLIYS